MANRLQDPEVIHISHLARRSDGETARRDGQTRRRDETGRRRDGRLPGVQNSYRVFPYFGTLFICLRLGHSETERRIWRDGETEFFFREIKKNSALKNSLSPFRQICLRVKPNASFCLAVSQT